MKKNNEGVECIHEGCKKEIYGGARRLCMKHYSKYFNRVRRGVVTWEELEAAGLCGKKMTQEAKNGNQIHSKQDLDF